MRTHNRTPASRVASLSRHIGPRISVVSAPTVDWSAWERERDLNNARFELEGALAAFEAARRAIAASNRMFALNAHDRELTKHSRHTRRRHAFIAINKARSRIVQARKALAKLADA